jgi:putative MFS transporter
LAAGASKAGGVLIIALVAFGVATPSLAETTLIGGIPMALAAAAILFLGVETKNRRLEQITVEEFNVASGTRRTIG